MKRTELLQGKGNDGKSLWQRYNIPRLLLRVHGAFNPTPKRRTKETRGTYKMLRHHRPHSDTKHLKVA